MALDANDARAYVYIDGERISPTWNPHDLVGVGQLSVKWGRTKALSKVPPTELSLTIIDPIGTWASDTRPTGRIVAVEARTDPGPTGSYNVVGVAFYGRITRVRQSRTRLHDPETGEAIAAWAVELTCHDARAEFAQAVVPGDGPNGQWPSEYPINRANRLDRLYGVNPVHITSPSNHLLNAHEFSEGMSIAALIDTLFSDVPGAHLNLTPTPLRTIDMGTTAQAGGLSLVWAAGMMSLIESDDCYLIPASMLEVSEELTLELGVDSAIDAVNVSWTDANGDEQVVQRATSRAAEPALGKRIWELRTDILNSAARAQSVAVEAVAVADTLNDRFELPPVRLNLVGRRSYDDLERHIYYGINTTTKPVAFPGSVLNGIPGAGVSFQVIGGVLEYDKGWSHTFNLAPAVGDPGNVTLAELVTHPDPTLADFDPSLSVGDLGLVSEGLAP